MNLLKHRSMRFYLVFFLILTMAVGGSAIAAFADGGTATATLNGGTLTESSTFNAGLTATLNGQDQIQTYTLPITVTDARGTGAIWYLQISGSPLTDGVNGHPALAQAVTSATAPACAGQGTCSNPATPTVTQVSISNALQDFYSDSSALGIFNVSTTIQVTIPGNAYAGTYHSTITLASAATP